MPLPSLPLGAVPLLSAAAGAVEVDVNPTLVLMQLGVVTVLMLVLKPFLFDPLLAVFERRERMVEGTQHEARDLDDKAADIKLQVDRVDPEGAGLFIQPRPGFRGPVTVGTVAVDFVF